MFVAEFGDVTVVSRVTMNFAYNVSDVKFVNVFYVFPHSLLNK